MARDAVSASILKSNLELLKKEGSELLNLFENVNKQSQALGTNMSQSVRSVIGEVRRLESSLSGLQSRLARLTSTSSALGAANISGALGMLTGQGRGYGGGGAYGGGGGGGGASPLSGGLFRGGMGAIAGGMLSGVVSKLPWFGGAIRDAARGAGGLFDFFQGMMMGGIKQSYGARASMERGSRTMGGMPGIGAGASQWKIMAQQLGYTPTESLGLAGAFQSGIGSMYGGKFFHDLSHGGRKPLKTGVSLGGRGGYGTHGPMAAFTGRAQAMGMDPREVIGLLRGLRGVGEGVHLAGPPKTADYGRRPGSAGTFRAYRGIGGGTPALDILGNLGGINEVLMTRAGIRGDADRGAERRYRNPLLMAGMKGLVGMQAGVGVPARGAMGRLGGLLGVLGDKTRGGFDPQIGNMLAMKLAQGTLTPGGGEAGNLFMMRAGGFGNPYIKGVQAQALKMGMDPSIIKRRGYMQWRRWKEGNPVERMQAMMAQMAYEGRGSDFQSLAISETMGIGQTYADRLVAMGNKGQFGSGMVDLLAEARGATGKGMIPPRATGAVKTDITSTIAAYNQALLKMSGSIGNIVKTINTLQVKNLDAISGALKSLDKDFEKLAQNSKTIKDLGDAYRMVGGTTVAILKAMLAAVPKKKGRN